MKTLLRKRCVFVLLSVTWNICLCKMSLCRDSSKNGASVPAKLGVPASVYLCVQSDHSVYGYIRIHHPSRGESWYPSNTGRGDLIHVVRVQDRKSMTVNITITQVADQDFNGVFTVTIYAKNQGGINYDDTLEYKFRLIREDEITTSTHEPVERTSSPSSITTTAESTVMDVRTFQATVASSVPPNTTSVTSAVKQHTASSSSTVPPSTSTVTSTAATTSKPWCHARENSGCPEKWYPVYDKTCLTVIDDIVSDFRKDYCKEYGARMPIQSDIDILKPCLMYLLQNSSSKTIRLNDTTKSLYDLEGTKVTKKPYRVACLLEKEKLASTVVTSFYIEKRDNPTLTHSWRQHLLNTSLNVVTIDTKRDTFYFVCTVTGYPDPQVQITHNSASLDHNFRDYFIARADCDDSGTYTCQAKNFHSSNQAQKRIQFLRSFEDVSFNITHKRKYIPGDYVSMRCAVDGCEAPNLLTLTNDIHQTVTYVPSATSLVMNITHVQCSDMGTYYCKAEGQDGRTVQKNVHLEVHRCPVQLCRGEDKSKILSAALHETVSFSLCLISVEKPYRDNPQKPTRISVNFQRSNFPVIYWTANITISNIQVSDYGNRSLNINNRYGIFEYHYQLKAPGPFELCPNEGNTQVISGALGDTVSFTICLISFVKPFLSDRHPQTKISLNVVPESNRSSYWKANITFFNIEDSDYRTHTIILSNQYETLEYQFTIEKKPPEGRESSQVTGPNNYKLQSETNIDPLFIWPPSVLAVVIIIIIIVLIYFNRARLFTSRTLNTSDSVNNDDSGQVMYANVKELTTGSSEGERSPDSEMETSLEKSGENVFSSDLTEQDSGRIVSDEGLVYITVIHAVTASNKKRKRAKLRPQKAKHDPQDCVEYVTLDYEKTGQFVITDEEEVTSEDHREKEESQNEEHKPKTDDATTAFDNNKE